MTIDHTDVKLEAARAQRRRQRRYHVTFLAIVLGTTWLLTIPDRALAGDLRVAWDASTQAGVVGYKVYFGTVSRQYGTPIDAGNVTSYTITGLPAGTYFVAVTAYGTGGTESGFSAEVTGTVSSGVTDTTPPVISVVLGSGITTNSATVTWTTDEQADTQVEIGLTTAYGAATPLDATLLTAHSQVLSGLSPGTTYHFRVKSKDAAGNLAVSGDSTFTTAPALDTLPPQITATSGGSPTMTATTVSWSTDEPSDSQVDYGLTIAYGSTTPLNTAMVAAHSQALSGLTADTTYHFRVRSRDAAGNLAASGDFTFKTAADTTPPVISGITSSSITQSGATLVWTTDEQSDTQADYGTTTAYGSTTALNTANVTAHSQGLTGLTAGTTYHFRVKSKDAAGNLATSGDFTFSTAADTTPPTISSVASSNVTGTGATIVWLTNEQADTQIQFGTTTAYGSTTVLDASAVTSHSQTLAGLAGGTTYHYRVKSKDAAGNLATSSDFTFKTTSPLSTGLVAAYNFDEGTGTATADYSGNSNTGTLINVSWTKGKFGTALQFNGNGSYTTTPGVALPAMNTALSIAYWLNTNAKATSTQPVVSLANGAQQVSIQAGYKDSQIGVWQSPGSWLVNGTQPSARAWHHIVYTYDGQTHRLYIDGTEVSSSTITATASACTNLQMGRILNGSDFLKASLDELRVYNRCLTPLEVQSLMTVTTP
jgi:type VI protein secretion system component Hcp